MTFAEVPVTYTMVEPPALQLLVLTACLRLTTSASATGAVAVGAATSSLVAERDSKIISVSLPARNPFWSALLSRTNRVDVSLLT